jgi:hypothetical protein
MRKHISKKVRDAVKNKFGGHCAYCGEIPEKICIDHIHPVIRSHHLKGADINDINNLMPSCYSCNSYKLSFTLEQFRSSLESQVKMARMYSINFRLAERFKLLEINEKPIKFYFESCGEAPQPESKGDE